MRVTVLGSGRWGSFLVWYAHSIGHEVTLWGRSGSRSLQRFMATGANEYLQLPASVRLSDDLPAALSDAEMLLIAISAQELRSLCRGMAQSALPTIVLCMKGIEVASSKRLTEVAREELGEKAPLAIWVGPGHVQDFLSGIPNCMVIDSDDSATTHAVVEAFTGPLIRFYYGTDLIGNEIGAAAKNVVGLAAGMLDGLGLSSLKGALMARSAREVSRLIHALGGQELTAYGLAHLGDYEATLFSPHSHNRRYGEAFVRKEPFEKLAEGVATASALMRLSKQCGADMPVTNAVHGILTNGDDPAESLNRLLLRPMKPEFETRR